MNTFSIIRDYLNDQTMRKLVLPKAKGLYYKSMDVRVNTSIGVFVNIEKSLVSIMYIVTIREWIQDYLELRFSEIM